MNGSEILRIVDAIHRDKAIDKEIVFEGIEQAILSAARKHFTEEEVVEVIVDRESGEPSLTCDGIELEADLLGDLLGRISAQTAKQVLIQKVREAERDNLYDEFLDQRSQLVDGQVTRIDRGTVIVNLGRIEAILPRGEQIARETFRVGDRVRAIVMDVRKAGSRVRVILSRTHAEFVRRLFERDIPEVADRVIEVRSIAREAGHRSKVAVSCSDTQVDCVGACVGVRGSRIRGIVDELNGERIDIVRWNDSLQILVPNALQPAAVEDVILCPMLGKVLVLVRDDQLSLAIGKRGQNVRLASKLVGWDINVMTQESLDNQLDETLEEFCVVPGIEPELAENLVSQGFFTFDDLSVIEPDQLLEMSGLTQEQCDEIIEYADRESLRIEEEEKRAYAERKLAERQAAENPAPPAATPAETESAVEEAESAGEESAGEESEESAEASGGDTEEAAGADASAGVSAEAEAASEPVDSEPVDSEPVDSETVEVSVAAEGTPEEAIASEPASGEGAAGDENPVSEEETVEANAEESSVEKTPSES